MYESNIGIIGYSGHSFVCIEIAKLNKINVKGYFDQNKKSINPLKLAYLGDEEKASDELELFIGIGDNRIRERVFTKLQTINKRLNITLTHPNTIVSQSTKIGSSSILAAGVIVNPLAIIGIGCIINTGSIIEHECIVGDFAHIAPGATLAGNVSIGKGTFIGANTTVKQGVKIGHNVIVGAGSVIINDVPDNAVVVGYPGKIIKYQI
jgi:sugar O-acyltransferase (sialic acid O-acetyltransferase NeuD family)